jgi:hypothetical protein
MFDVDFVVNCYERTYRDVLTPGLVSGLAASQRFTFAAVTVLINNVDDRDDAKALAEELLSADPGVTRVEFVADHLAYALACTGLNRRRMRRLPHFSDCCLVATSLVGPEWLCYWDADATLQEPCDWVTPTLEYMAAHADVAVGNPNNWHSGLAEREALSIDGNMAIGYGFSDVAFLATRTRLCQPIYRKIAPSSWRYPLAHVEPIFEQRVDAWMRRTGGLRATYLPSVVTHPTTVGANYPDPRFRERIRSVAMNRTGRLAATISAHPAMRAWR